MAVIPVIDLEPYFSGAPGAIKSVAGELATALDGKPGFEIADLEQGRPCGACMVSPVRRCAPLPPKGASALGRPCSAHFTPSAFFCAAISSRIPASAKASKQSISKRENVAPSAVP